MKSKALDLLGLKVRDRVTGYTGVVTSISFDLQGCVQAIVNPGLNKEKKPSETFWWDVQRLEVLSSKRVMPRPAFSFETGPEPKPASTSNR